MNNIVTFSAILSAIRPLSICGIVCQLHMRSLQAHGFKIQDQADLAK
jgi:hypothetical protein